MPYQPIESYGIVGDMRTAALVGMNGSIDWFCYPNFDSPSVFAAILDETKGGRFSIAPVDAGAAASKQFYWPDTNVLVTRFFTHAGVAEVTDFMPVGDAAERLGRGIIRFVRVTRGVMKFRVECRPAFNYARDDHELARRPNGVCFRWRGLMLSLSTTVPLREDGGGVSGEFELEEDMQETFVLAGAEREECAPVLSRKQTEELFRQTVAYWRGWLRHCTYKGRWREMVHRSALALKLLTYEPTGAIVAAPTCSLPETVGGGRNWDYRYTWIRDAAFTIYGFLRIGFTEEAAAFMDWLEARCHELAADGSLQVVYGIDGRHELREETLEHLEGYCGSRPVRIGNGAYRQLQLDIYGELLDSVYLYNKYGSPISSDLWMHLRRLVNWVCRHWPEPDEGIWEVRGGRRHFVYSKLMCWVAADRALRLAEKRSFPADRERWLETRDRLYQEILEKGWSERRRAFVQYYGSDVLDAANLMMPLTFFMSPTDRRMLKTLDAINRPPAAGGLVSSSLVYRYNVGQTPDGLRGDEGTFNICTFWLVEALTRAGRTDHQRLEEARLMFERMLGFANHLGLYAEETGARGEALGNFPQAFTHLALISAAYNLDRALEASR